MKIKLDENLSRHLKPEIAKLNHDVLTAAEEGLQGKPDPEVGMAARVEGRVVFTLDLEFADLRKYPPGSHPGVVLFRPRSMGPSAVNTFILDFVRKADPNEMIGCVVVVEPHRIRLRRPPIDSDPAEWVDVPVDS